MIVKFSLVHENAKLPAYATEGAAGFDLCSCEHATVPPHSQWLLVSTGLQVELPVGYEGQIRPRSGLAVKHGITVLNTPGTIDSDYRGIIKVILQNHSADEFQIKPGDRIAQMVIAPAMRVAIELSVTNLSKTSRGAGGFGSTGV